MRINFFGGPGIGKSTTAARTFAQLKERHYSVELVAEFAKTWVQEGKAIDEEAQVYFFGRQMHAELQWLRHGVKNIITDSPLALAIVYTHVYGNQGSAEDLWRLCQRYDARYPYANIYLKRGKYPYDTQGRLQTEAEAHHIDEFILDFLQKNYPPETLTIVPADNPEAILQAVLKSANAPGGQLLSAA